MKKLISICLMVWLALGAGAAHAASPSIPLIGTWSSIDNPETALPGTITLERDGRAVLSPEGHEQLQGTWSTTGQMLKFTMPPYGQTVMSWTISKGLLQLTYENGLSQHFKKTAK